MSFRRRIALVSAAAVAVAVVLAALLVYLLTSNQLHSQLDNQLRNRARGAERVLALLEHAGKGLGVAGGRTRAAASLFGPLPAQALSTLARSKPPVSESGARLLLGRLPPNPDQVRGYQQVVDAGGKILGQSSPQLALPVDAATRRLASSGGATHFSDARVHGVHLRVLAEPFGRGEAVQLAQPLTEVDSLLARLRLILALIVVGGIALAALLGRLVSGTAVAPLRRLSEATEHVTLTRDLSRRIAPAGEDEIGRLAASFNAMLDALQRSVGALDASVHAQRQLVADASHELRTPVTSLRTNIEILQQQAARMEPHEQRRLLDDVVAQIEELTLLMNDLIDLARGEEPRVEREDVRLDLLVEEVLERTRRHAPDTPFAVELEPTILAAVPARLERAVGNLLDNAVKYGPRGARVEVKLREGELTVRDHGDGIAAEELPHVFDRFYRGADARRKPGSGLGLAIVAQVAARLGGSVAAEPVSGGGTVMRLRLPGAEPADAPDANVDAGAALRR